MWSWYVNDKGSSDFDALSDAPAYNSAFPVVETRMWSKLQTCCPASGLKSWTGISSEREDDPSITVKCKHMLDCTKYILYNCL